MRFGWLFLIIGVCVWASHTPSPSQEGRLECYFLLIMSVLCGEDSPLERGLKGCVMVRSVGWDEMFFEVGSVGLWVAVFDYRCLCAGVTHPQPLSRGEIWK